MTPPGKWTADANATETGGGVSWRASNARPCKSFWQPDRCIVAVADYVDRHRRRGESEEKIRRQLSDQSGTRFDSACVQAMLEIM